MSDNLSWRNRTSRWNFSLCNEKCTFHEMWSTYGLPGEIGREDDSQISSLADVWDSHSIYRPCGELWEIDRAHRKVYSLVSGIWTSTGRAWSSYQRKSEIWHGRSQQWDLSPRICWTESRRDISECHPQKSCVVSGKEKIQSYWCTKLRAKDGYSHPLILKMFQFLYINQPNWKNSPQGFSRRW